MLFAQAALHVIEFQLGLVGADTFHRSAVSFLDTGFNFLCFTLR